MPAGSMTKPGAERADPARRAVRRLAVALAAAVLEELLEELLERRAGRQLRRRASIAAGAAATRLRGLRGRDVDDRVDHLLGNVGDRHPDRARAPARPASGSASIAAVSGGKAGRRMERETAVKKRAMAVEFSFENGLLRDCIRPSWMQATLCDQLSGGLGRNSDPDVLADITVRSAAHQPDQQNTDHGRNNPDRCAACCRASPARAPSPASSCPERPRKQCPR